MNLFKVLTDSLADITTATSDAIVPAFKAVSNMSQACEIHSRSFKLDAEAHESVRADERSLSVRASEFKLRKKTMELEKEIADFEALLN